MDDMYHSPIEISQIQEDINIAFEDGVFKAVRRVGVNVDKEELLKALAYDRGQYEQGYHDALKAIVQCKDCKYGEECTPPSNDWYCRMYDQCHTGDWFCADGEVEVKQDAET